MSRLKSIVAGAVVASTSALAHDNHGLYGSHWHASDALGFAVAIAIVAGLLWARRK